MSASPLPAHTLCAVLCSFLFLPHSDHAPAPQSPAAPSLLVVNQGDASLSIIDPTTNREVATIPEGVPKMVGHEVAVSPDGRYAWLPLYGDAGVGRPGTDGDVMLVVDLRTRTVSHRIPFGKGVRPHCVRFDPVSGLLYVTTEIGNSVSVIDPHTFSIVGSIPTHQDQSHMLALSHDGRWGYTANVGPGTVSVLDLKSRTFVTSIPIAQTTQRISISHDDKTVFTSDQGKPRMALIDTGTRQIRRWLDLPGIGYGTALTRDDSTLLVTLPALGQVAVVDLHSGKVLHTLAVGPRPQEVIIRPDEKFAYISCFGSKDVAVLNLSTWQIDATIQAGAKADGMAWAPPAA